MEINEAKKDYCTPMHTTEHILNQTMVQMFGCSRSVNAHIEKKKSKCDYYLESCPTPNQIEALTKKVNQIIDSHLPVTIELMLKEAAKEIVDLSKLPADATDTVRIVRVGNYDACACIGAHVENTSQIGGHFQIISHDFNEGRWRLRFKII